MLGRASEGDRCRRVLDSGGSVLLYGPAGIGKSTLLEALATGVAEAGGLVLRTAPGEAEAHLPHLALLDLLGDTPILRPRTATASEQLAVRLHVTSELRRLAEGPPVLVVIDNVQWLDDVSLEVLAFAARRVGGGGLRVLAAERVDAGAEPRGRVLCPVPAEEVCLDGLDVDATRSLIRERAPGLSPSTVDRLCTASGGNPWYAIELAHEATAAPSDRVPVPNRLRSHLAAGLTGLTDDAMSLLLTVAAAERPGRELFPPGDPALRDVLARGIVVAEADGRLRFSRPLLAEFVYGQATETARRETHARLATLLEDPIERIRHRGLAAEPADGDLSRELSEAAALAAQRGSPAKAAALSRLSALHTRDPAEAARRLLDSSAHACAAGLPDQARATCEAVLRRADPAARVGARLLLAELSNTSPQAMREHLTAAETDAGDDPVLLGRVRLMLADVTVREVGIGGAAEEIAEAERLARRAGDDELLLQALALRVPAEMQHDAGGELPAFDEAIELAEGRPLTDASVWVRQCHAVVLLRSGQTRAAMAKIRRLRADVERAGRARDLCRVLYTFSSVSERAGYCRQAAEAARQCGPLWTSVGLPPAPALAMLGLAELNTGTAARAAELLGSAVECGESTGDPEWTAYSHVLLGRAELLRGEHGKAARDFGRGRDLLRGLGYDDPAMILIEADLAEALALGGDLPGASEVITEGIEAARRRRRDVVMLGLGRAQALVDGLAGDPRTAADRWRAAVPTAHPYPLELARCSLTLAFLERRARRRAAARQALQRARAQFAAAGCAPWSHHTQQQLDRLDTTGTETTELDLRLMELVRAGVSNRAMASALHLSVKAVEANLTRLYRRHGVSGRTELRSQLAAVR